MHLLDTLRPEREHSYDEVLWMKWTLIGIKPNIIYLKGKKWTENS